MKRRPRKRKQLLLKLAVFLLLGAIINVAVAWGCSWYGPSTNPSKLHAETAWSDRKLPDHQSEGPLPRPTHWIVKQHQRFGGTRSVVAPAFNPGSPTDYFDRLLPNVNGFPDQLAIRESQTMSNGDWATFFVWDASGWPMRCLSCSWPWWRNPDWPAPPIRGGISIGNPSEVYPWPFGVFELRALPYVLRWPGFAINTIFYAALLWVLWITPGKIRRFIRIRGHRCPACGYKIDSAPGIGPRCSECGAVLPLPLGEGRGEGARGEG